MVDVRHDRQESLGEMQHILGYYGNGYYGMDWITI